MHKSFLKSSVLAVVTALAVTLMPSALAQVVTSGLAGTVTSTDGAAISGATVTLVHTPTNATFTDTTNANGHYNFSGLPVGGPYTITTSAAGYTSEPTNDINTELGNTIDVNLSMKSEVLKLEKFVATGSRNDFDSNSQGPSVTLTAERLAAKPTTQRSLADLVSATPGITLRSLSGDREEAQITAVGQNNRYNSWMIDGNRINDQFGLNATGLASFFNPLAFDALSQISVKLAPYDVWYSGFTGAALNAVTRSGTNSFHGSLYYIFSGDHLAGLQMQGPDSRTLAQSGVKIVPKLERTTKGLTFGGPLWRDHVFFFLNWEKFNRVGAPSSAGLPSVSSADLATIDGRVAQILAANPKIDYGHIGGNANSRANEEKKLAKIDWHITPTQSLSLRYSTAEGQVPQFGSFTTTSSGTGLNVGASIVGGAATAYDSHFYAQQRKEKSLSAQLVSQWSSDLKSQLKWSHVKQDQYTPTAVIAPEIDIYGVTGVNQTGATVTNGVVVLGTERFRHGNQINVDTKNYSGVVDYVRGDATLSAGFDMENNHYFNLFRQSSYGVFNYASPAAFAADTVSAFRRDFTDLALKGTYADVSQYTQGGLFGQVKWQAAKRLKVQLGVRVDRSTSDTKPAFNQQFLTDTGMRNDGTIDGAKDISPRFSFNWALDEARVTQVRGGYGYFVGRSPWVFFSNSYGAAGVGTFSSLTTPVGGLTGYLATSFDPANPLGTATQTGLVRADMALTDAGIHMPSLWRGNIGIDHKLGFLGSMVTLEFIHSINDHTTYITNDNIKPRGVALDGRTYFFGSLNTAANTRYPNYINIYHTQNVKAGESTYVTLAWDRPMKDHWAFNLSYTRGRSTEAQANGQTTASGAWQRNAVFNQGTVLVGHSDFEVKDRVQANITREFMIIKNMPTTASIYYEGRTGSPFSYTYSNDMNADSFSGNDLVAVPTDLSDSRFDFSGLSAADQTAMMAFFQKSGLSKYAGSYAPKNVFSQPWVNKLDLVVRQAIPLHYQKSKLELELAFTNIGTFLSKSLFNYTERASSTVNDVFDRRLVGNATINTTTGKLTVTSFNPEGSATNAFLIDNTMSRWRIQLTARLSF